MDPSHEEEFGICTISELKDIRKKNVCYVS